VLIRDDRHGARLDAEDKSWYLQSPTPYDPPLSYGGWNQSKSLGVRIAKILTSNTYSDPDATHGLSHSKQKSKKIVIHSSPFQRCVQTAIGVAAGISQSIPAFHSSNHSVSTGSTKPFVHYATEMHNSRLRERTKDISKISMQTLQEEEEPTHFGLLEMPILRIDAFLGEWLSPDYFENITHPPSSPLMVLSAKAELLVEEDIDAFEPSPSIIGHFPGGWQKAESFRLNQSIDEIPPIDITSGRSSLAQALSRHRASSQSRVSDVTGLSHSAPTTSSAFLAYGGFYHPPVPTYAVSPSDSIPRGYVAHACKICVDVDIQWDSMKEPQEWGDGGEFGEEWSSMHRRFRKGIINMVDWYNGHSPSISNDEIPDEGSKESTEDFELVVILITHSSGCNALIGALANQPVLIDVGQASLTLATRRESTKATLPLSSSPTGHRREPVDVGLSNDYEVKIRASTDHLRAETGPSSLTAIMTTQSPTLKPTQESPRTSEYLSIRTALPRKVTRSTRTFSSSSSPSPSSSVPTRSSTMQSSGGLWKKSQTEQTDNYATPTHTTTTEEPPPDLTAQQIQQARGRTLDREEAIELGEDAAPRGLWSRPKRRWTTTESSF
jgi:broad specificity phosphatase PhoE